MLVEVLSFILATLPTPVVVYVTTISVEAYQVHTATTLKVELTAPLIADVAERIRVAVFILHCSVGTAAYLVDGHCSVLCSLATVQACIGFSEREVSLGSTQQEEVGVWECGIMTLASIYLEVGEFGNGKA